MLRTQQDESNYRVTYRSYLPSLLLLMIPPVMLYQLGPRLLEGSLDASELVGLALSFALPLLGAYFLTEIACFDFSLEQDSFSWRWHNFIQRRAGQVPLQRVVRIRRDALPFSGVGGHRFSYRLVAMLDDERVLPLTRGFSALYERELERIVKQIRAHLGHVVAAR